MKTNWTCPFCNHKSVVTDDNFYENNFIFNGGAKYKDQALKTGVIVCPNDDCQEYSLMVFLHDTEWQGKWKNLPRKREWRLIPDSSARPLPEYVPAPIVQDYREACLIMDLSPKASATLARRCLQGMIRDFWGVKKGRLVDEISDIKDKVDFLTWDAIEAVRNVGNIGAHMEKDINLVIDVDPDEASLLIGLIETLIDEWYINRHERQLRMLKIAEMAAEKKDAKTSKIATGSVGLSSVPGK